LKRDYEADELYLILFYYQSLPGYRFPAHGESLDHGWWERNVAEVVEPKLEFSEVPLQMSPLGLCLEEWGEEELTCN
jgi:hypothetical protein